MAPWLGRAWLIGAVGCSAPRSAPAPVPVPVVAAPADAPWPLVEGWKPEVIAFPLGFAPSIDLVGEEVLRFAPGFYAREAPGYFTYAFVWRVAVPSYPVTAAWVMHQLAAYFDGLCAAVSDPPGTGCSTHPAQVSLAAPATTPFLALAGVPAHRVTVQAFDAFEANQPVGLAGTVTVARCGKQMLVAVTLAPPAGRAMAALDEQARRFAVPASCVDALP